MRDLFIKNRIKNIIIQLNLFLVGMILLFSLGYHQNVYASECESIEYISPSGVSENIKFTFIQPYPCGKFANGDWWVSKKGNQEVIINSITPKAVNGLNGYELNPNNKKMQPYDFRIRRYDKAFKPSLPLKVLKNTSVIKTVSVSENKSNCKPCVQYAAVLTIVEKPLLKSNAILRPGYFGKKKKFYNINDIDFTAWPKIASKYLKHINTISYNDIYNRYKNLQLDHLEGWIGRYIHPVDNMPDYGAEIATTNAISILRMMLDDFDLNNNLHKSALINYLQMGIDIKSMLENGVTWPAGGGHGNGRKLPLLVAGLLLKDDSFHLAIQKSTFSEDNQVYYSSKTGRALYGQLCRDRYYWNRLVKRKGPKDCRDPYEYIDGGSEKIGRSYQLCCTAKPWKYTATAISLLGLKTNWDNNAFFDYIERWVKHGTWAKPDPCAPYNGVPNQYGIKWGGDKTCVQGAGRFISRHGISKDAGYYNHPLGDEMWKFYKY